MPGMYAPPAVELPNTSAIVGIPSADSRVRSRNIAPPGMKISFCVGRSAPPDSTRLITGSRLARAISSARSALRSVHGLLEPPFTVGSFAVIRHSTPATTPIPVTRLAPTVKLDPQPASGESSRKYESGSRSSSMRSRASSLPRRWWRSTYFSPPPASALACSVSRAPSFSSIASRLSVTVMRWTPLCRAGSRRRRHSQQDLRYVDVPRAQPLAERLCLRVEAGLRGDTFAKEAFDDEVDRPQIGKEVTVDDQRLGLGEQPFEQADSERVREPTPRLLLPDPHADVRVAAFVAGSRTGDAAERDLAGPRPPARRELRQRHRRLDVVDGRQRLGLGGRVDHPAGTVREYDDLLHLVDVDVPRVEDAVRRTVARRRGDVEAGVARQSQLDRRAGEGAADDLRIRVLHRAPEEDAGFFLGLGVRRLGPGERPPQLGRALRERLLELTLHQLGLLLQLQSGEDEVDLVAEAADAVQRHLVRRRRRFTADAGDPDPVGAVGLQLDRVESRGDVRTGVPGAADLIEQLGLDRV